MKVLIGDAERGPVVASAIVVGALAVLSFSVFTGLPVLHVAPIIGIVVVAAVAYRSVLAWRTLLAAMILVILFIPIRRYTMPMNLPFQLEPYRILVALVAAAWVSSMLIDPRVRFRRTGLEPWMLGVWLAVLISVIVNGHRIAQLGVGTVIAKKLTFLASFFLVTYMIVSLARRLEQIDFLVKVVVVGGAIVAFFALIEARTRFNVFNHLSAFIPLLKLNTSDLVTDLGRGGRMRVYASAQHPIALSAALIMIVPLAIYLARSTGRRRWWLAGSLVMFGSLAALSRTAIVMLSVMLFVYLRQRPRETKRLLKLGIVPLLLALHLAVPGAIGTLADSFHPKGGLAKEQEVHPGTSAGGRIVKAIPTLHQWERQPLLGYGYGSRVIEGPKLNAIVLDDEWLDVLFETGAIGAVAWVGLLVAFGLRMSRRARSDPSPRGWLFTGVTASVAAYGFSMATYDAMSFIQVTLVLFILFGVGSAALAGDSGRPLGRPARAGDVR
jgi:hypothetical protein